MTYLDERIEFTFLISGTTPNSGMCKYELCHYDTANPSQPEKVLFVGNFYYNGSDRRVTLDVTDIVRSLKMNPSKDFFIGNGYTETQDITLIERFEVKAYFSTGTLNTGWKLVSMVYRYPNYRNTNDFSNGNAAFFDIYSHEDEEQYTASLQGLKSNRSLSLVPHYPLKNTSVYKFAQSFNCGMYLQDITLSMEGGTYGEDITFVTAQGVQGTLFIKAISEMIEWNSLFAALDNDISAYDSYGAKIATFDSCYKRYYLFWQDRFGGYQSQAFNEYATYSESFNIVETQNYKNERNKSNIQIQPKWKLSSGWIGEEVYPLYESIYVSSILLLYDSQEDKLYEVTIKGDYTEKTYRSEKKLLNITLDLEAISKQQIIY